jgi:hypothetical protein
MTRFRDLEWGCRDVLGDVAIEHRHSLAMVGARPGFPDETTVADDGDFRKSTEMSSRIDHRDAVL